MIYIFSLFMVFSSSYRFFFHGFFFVISWFFLRHIEKIFTKILLIISELNVNKR